MEPLGDFTVCGECDGADNALHEQEVHLLHRDVQLQKHKLQETCATNFSRASLTSQVPGPGLEMQYAILLICFVSSFASLGKVFLQEEENTDGWRPRKCRYTSYSQWYLKPQR